MLTESRCGRLMLRDMGVRMGFGRRVFVVEGNNVKRMPAARYDRIWDREEALPEYAGRRLKTACVYVETAGRNLTKIVSVYYGSIPIGADGLADRDAIMQDAVVLIDAADQASRPLQAGKEGVLLDARRAFARRRGKFEWKPSEKVQEAIGRALAEE